ncbi:type I-E CRISPR-associated protein Cas5/CasD [Ileibacterium valens]|uniref:type I-E CRISPR-associated protein Cas5/CasD n=1 Tax=Ileibacterium valens TaxID=1862668 RepID=UPI002729F09D|nr:type I-E CRISPR-associated protein Cas5/CasD [Ileibacterium valens]
MAYTLLLRLAGPMQSWGSDSHFEIRKTDQYPTKSGVIGMLAAALGRSRDADISDLKKLDFGVRVDQPGETITDFHTARKDSKTSYITRRSYLSDAVFVVGISSDDRSLIEKIEYALNHPAYPLFLGRRSCPPVQPLTLGVKDDGLKAALLKEPWHGSSDIYKNSVSQEQLKLVLEGRGAGVIRRVNDSPSSFDFHDRQYESRLISEIMVPKVNTENTDHDVMSFLEDLE